MVYATKLSASQKQPQLHYHEMDFHMGRSVKKNVYLNTTRKVGDINQKNLIEGLLHPFFYYY